MLKYQDILTAFTKHVNAILPEGSSCSFRVEQPSDKMIATLSLTVIVKKKKETFLFTEEVKENNGSYRDALELACKQIIFAALLRGLLNDKIYNTLKLKTNVEITH